jgi:hypothetical protein
VVTAVELALAAAVLADLVIVGVGFGAYGPRMVTATLTHGPASGERETTRSEAEQAGRGGGNDEGA